MQFVGGKECVCKFAPPLEGALQKTIPVGRSLIDIPSTINSSQRKENTMKKRIFTTLAVATLTALLTTTPHAALLEGTPQADVLIGEDDDNINNPDLQLDAAANQSLDNADVLLGNAGNDVLIGLLGSDTMHGGPGRDILIGGTEGGSPAGTLKSDIMFGDQGDDVSIWAGGDGNHAFLGGPGSRDALVFGTIDRVDNVPTLTAPVPGFPHGVPTANVTGQNAFCTLDRVPEDNSLGYAFLVRFRGKPAGNLIVTVRVDAEVEHVFCTSETAAAIAFADLTEDNPHFNEVTLDEVKKLNRTVAEIIR
jgi:hypothetical protein